jgi:DNA repair exonuclease SbcCD ATPase subunit
MKIIDFKELRFSNILSYGNNINTFPFDVGVNWIKGNNGNGKSTLVEALTYVLFGEPYRDINLEHLVNSVNKKNLISELDFTIIDSYGTNNYTIRRGMFPKVFEILKNGDRIDNEAGLTQSNLESDILGFNKRLFTNVISLNTLETKPFLDMKPDDKRKLIESIITLDISKFKKRISTDLTSANVRLTTSSNDVKAYSNKIIELETIMQKLETEKEVGISELENQLKKMESNLSEQKEKQINIKTELEKISTLGKEAVSKYENYKNLDIKISNIQQVIMISDEMVSLRESFSKKTEELIKQNEIVIKLEKEKENISSKITKHKEKLLEHKDLESNINSTNNKIYLYQSELDKIIKAKDTVQVGVPCPTCGKPSTEEDKEKLLSKYREDWKLQNNNLKEVKKELEKLSKIKETIHDVLKKELDKHISESVKVEQSINPEKKLKVSMETDVSSIAKQIEDKKQRSDILIPEFNVEKDSKDLLVNKLDELKKNKVYADQLNNEIIKLKEVVSNKKSEIVNLETAIKTITSDIQELKVKIEKKKEVTEQDSIGITKKQILESKRGLSDSQENMTKSSDDIELLQFMSGMFGDEGIKRTVIGTFVPVLNKAIDRNLKVFDLPFSIEFDDSLNYKFCNGYGSAPVYDGLSQGQKRKLHFSISMAFRDFVSMVGDFKINMLFLDEVLDISVDDVGLENMVSVLKSKNLEIPSIYVMTHRGETFQNEWNHVVEVMHDGRFSELKQIS